MHAQAKLPHTPARNDVEYTLPPRLSEKIWLTADDVAYVLSMSASKIRRLAARGELDSVRVGSDTNTGRALRLYPRHVVEAYAARVERKQGVEVDA